MARQLYQRDSAAFHLNATRRHIRLARQQKGAEGFADAIQPFFLDLQEKQKLTVQANQQREDTYDDIMYADQALDDAIRTTYETCKQYDRNHPGEALVLKIFPNGTFSEIVNMPYAEEPLAADRIAVSIENLGEKHPVYSLVADLRAKIAGVNATLEAYKQNLTHLTHAQVAEEASKASLRQQYEFNYLDARKQLGTTYAERIFPQLSVRSKTTTEEEAATATSATK
ncbi:MAG: hypothetical protein Q8928_14295 [Bacteroidota bacterium]|nr:hypothetical protein [Bacteroidota bacterium]